MLEQSILIHINSGFRGFGVPFNRKLSSKIRKKIYETWRRCNFSSCIFLAVDRSWSQLTDVNVKNATQINGFCQFFDFFRFFRENCYFLSGDRENSAIRFGASRSIDWYLRCFRANRSVQLLSKNRDFQRFLVSLTHIVGPTRVRCHSIRLSKTNQMV